MSIFCYLKIFVCLETFIMTYPNFVFNTSNEVESTFKAQRQDFSFKRLCVRDVHCFISEEAALKIENMKKNSAVIQRYPQSESVRSVWSTFTVVGTLNMDIEIARSPNYCVDVTFKIVKSMYFCENTGKFLEFYEDSLLPFGFY